MGRYGSEEVMGIMMCTSYSLGFLGGRGMLL